MKFITIRFQEKEMPALLVDDNAVLPLKAILGESCPGSLLELIQINDDIMLQKLKQFERHLETNTIPLDSVTLFAPIPRPVRNIICLGLNYRDHAAELSDSFAKEKLEPEAPIYFGKMATEIIGHNALINSHRQVTHAIDYEVELLAVIGQGGTNISPENAFNHIFGYTIMNDVSARDLQQRHSQWIRGKSLDTFTAMGPALIHRSCFTDPPELTLSCRVNGETRQLSNTRNFIFDIPTVISDLSKGMTLLPGDMIATGTPAGVGMGHNPPKYLNPGDQVECMIEGIGTLTNWIDE